MGLGAILGPSWGPLGALLGPSWGHLGPILGPSGAILGPYWAILGDLGRVEGEIGEPAKTFNNLRKSTILGLPARPRSAKLGPKSGLESFKRHLGAMSTEAEMKMASGSALEAVLDASCAILGPFGRRLGPQEAVRPARVGPAWRNA